MATYQSYLFVRNRHRDIPLILLIDGDRLRAYDQDAVVLATVMGRQTVPIGRHKTLDVDLAELPGLKRRFSPIMIL